MYYIKFDTHKLPKYHIENIRKPILNFDKLKEEIYPHNDTSNLSAQIENMSETGRRKKNTVDTTGWKTCKVKPLSTSRYEGNLGWWMCIAMVING